MWRSWKVFSSCVLLHADVKFCILLGLLGFSPIKTDNDIIAFWSKQKSESPIGKNVPKFKAIFPIFLTQFHLECEYLKLIQTRHRPLHFPTRTDAFLKQYIISYLCISTVVNLTMHFMIVIYDSRVVLTRKLPILRH